MNEQNNRRKQFWEQKAQFDYKLGEIVRCENFFFVKRGWQ